MKLLLSLALWGFLIGACGQGMPGTTVTTAPNGTVTTDTVTPQGARVIRSISGSQSTTAMTIVPGGAP